MALELNEDRWAFALRSVGREELMARLTRYPGRLQDPINDLPLEPPYPSREFCLNWCADEENRSVASNFNTAVVLGLLGLMMVSFATCTVSQLLGTSMDAASTQRNTTPPTPGSATPGSGSLAGQASSSPPPPGATFTPYSGSTSTGSTSSGSTSSGSTSTGSSLPPIGLRPLQQQ